MRQLFIALLALLGFTGAAEALSVTFTQVPEGVTISVLTDSSDALVEVLTPEENGNVVFEVPFADDTWRAEPTFFISIPQREVEGIVLNDPLEVELGMSVKRISRDVTVPIELFRGVGNRERTRIEGISGSLFFQKLVLSQALAKHYLAKLPDRTEPNTKRMTRIWATVIFDSVMSPALKRPLRQDSMILDTFRLVFANEADPLSNLEARQRQIGSAFWFDRDDSVALARSRDCIGLRALNSFLRSRHEANVEAAAVRSIADPERVLAMLDAEADRICGPTDAGTVRSPL